MCGVVNKFWHEQNGGVRTGGPLMYIIVLGLFMSVVAAMGSENGARRLAGHAGPTVELNIGSWFSGNFAGGMRWAGTFQ